MKWVNVGIPTLFDSCDSSSTYYVSKTYSQNGYSIYTYNDTGRLRKYVDNLKQLNCKFNLYFYSTDSSEKQVVYMFTKNNYGISIGWASNSTTCNLYVNSVVKGSFDTVKGTIHSIEYGLDCNTGNIKVWFNNELKIDIIADEMKNNEITQFMLWAGASKRIYFSDFILTDQGRIGKEKVKVLDIKPQTNNFTLLAGVDQYDDYISTVRTYINLKQKMPAGKIKTFYFNANNASCTGNFMIFRVVDGKYKCVYKSESYKATTYGFFSRFDLSEEVEVEKDDLLGFRLTAGIINCLKDIGQAVYNTNDINVGDVFSSTTSYNYLPCIMCGMTLNNINDIDMLDINIYNNNTYNNRSLIADLNETTKFSIINDDKIFINNLYLYNQYANSDNVVKTLTLSESTDDTNYNVVDNNIDVSADSRCSATELTLDFANKTYKIEKNE